MAKINIKTFKEALRNSGGNQSRIAGKLEVSRAAVNQFLKKHPNMRELLENEAEQVIDIAEDNIDTYIMTHGDIDSSKWKLTNSKRGKSRGYGQKQEVENIGGGNQIIFQEIVKSNEEIKESKNAARIKANQSEQETTGTP